MKVEFKDIISLAIGTVIGLWAGIAIYWLPLGQLRNEFKALWHLRIKRFNRGDRILVKAGVDLKPLDSNLRIATTGGNQVTMLVWADKGVGWHHTSSGWKRVRILHIHNQGDQLMPVYKICQDDLV